MKLLKNYLYSASYQIVSIITPLITIPYISRVLGPEAVGINSYTSSILTYFVLFANLGIMTYGNRAISYNRDSIEKRTQVFWEIAGVKACLGFTSFIGLIFFALFYREYTYYILLQSPILLANIIDISWFFSGMEEFKQTVIRNIIVKLVLMVAIFLFVHQPNDLPLYILIFSMSTFLGNLSLWTYLKHYLVKVSFSDLNLQIHLLPTINLFVPQLMTGIFVTVNKILLANLSSLTQTAFYDNSDKMIRIVLAFIIAVGTVIFPRIANNFAKGNMESVQKYLIMAFNLVNLIAFPAAAGLIAVSKSFSNIYFGQGFSGIEYVLSILSVSLIFMGWSAVIGSQFLIAINKPKDVTVAAFVAVVISVSVSLIFIPKYGAIGAAISALTGELTLAAVQAWMVKQYTKLRLLFFEIPHYFIASLLMYVAIASIRLLSLSVYVLLPLQVISGGIVYILIILLLRPKTIMNLLREVKHRR